MSSHTTPIVDELAKDYANYLKLDLSSQVCTLLYITSISKFQFIIKEYFFISYSCRNLYILKYKIQYNITFQMKNFHETIEDVMMRLEEFQSIIEMVRNHNLI